MINLEKVLIFCKQKAKQLIVSWGRHLPVISKYIFSPKGYYNSSEEYWKFCQANGLHGVTYTPFLPASISQRLPPKSIYRQTHWKFDGRYLHKNPETFVVSIPDGKTFGSMGTVITHDDKLLFDVSLHFGVGSDLNKVKSHYAFNTLKLSKCQQLPETAALLATACGEGYFHWLTDALPRLEILRKALPEGTEAIDKYIVNRGIPVIVESLRMLNVPSDRLVFADSKQIQAKHLVVPSLPGATGDPPSWVCTFLRENFLKHQADITPIPKLYISRSKARYRRVINEENVLEYLSKFGFIPVWLEEHDFATQIALFSNAKFIVAPHGAGLTNLMWCNAGTRVLEIFSPNYVNICFWAIANQIGLEYCYLIGNGEKPRDYFDPHLFQDDIEVSIEELIQSLEIFSNSPYL